MRAGLVVRTAVCGDVDVGIGAQCRFRLAGIWVGGGGGGYVGVGMGVGVCVVVGVNVSIMRIRISISRTQGASQVNYLAVCRFERGCGMRQCRLRVDESQRKNKEGRRREREGGC